MVTDYEQAWIRLSALVASKTQHGREPLLVAMAEIAEECRVPSGELAKLLRLYGVEVERARSVSTEEVRDEAVASGVDDVRDGMPASPATMTRGGHDGSGHGTEDGAGRGAGDGRLAGVAAR